MTERKSRLQQELRIIPLGWTVAAGIGIVVVESLWSFVIPHFAHGDLPPRPWFDMLGAVGALLMAATILLTGYIYADAKRRGMNAVLWTVLVFLTPKPIGFIAYFLLRTPMLAAVPAMQRASGQGFHLLSEVRLCDHAELYGLRPRDPARLRVLPLLWEDGGRSRGFVIKVARSVDRIGFVVPPAKAGSEGKIKGLSAPTEVVPCYKAPDPWGRA